MDQKKRIAKLYLSVCFFLCYSVLCTATSFAANTTLGIYPNQGTFNDIFSVDLVVDGQGESFNAAEARVTIADELKAQDLILGDCDFSFTTMPSLNDPSFQGVILGGSHQKCTVYTLTVAPISGTDTTISIHDASIRRYGDAANILSSVINGTYTLSGHVTTVPANNLSDIPLPEEKKYLLILTVLSPENKPLSDATVSLKPVGNTHTLEKKSDQSGTVSFTDLTEGIYTLTANKDQNSSTTVVNLSGKNQVLSLSIKLKPDTPYTENTFIKKISDHLLIVICVCITIVSLVFALWMHIKHKKS